MNDHKNKNGIEKSKEHLANERTFLAWIRTSIALMGFGFVIVRFGLFLKQLSFVLGAEEVASDHYSGIVGITMVGLGTVIAFLAFYRFLQIRRQLYSDSYSPKSTLSFLLALILLIGGTLLTLYLISGI